MKLKQVIICLLLGHDPYTPRVFDKKGFVIVKDILGHPLVEISICQRCGLVYGKRI